MESQNSECDNEMYLMWLDRSPISRPYQYVSMIIMLSKNLVNMLDMVEGHGYKMDNNALSAMRREIEFLKNDISILKAGVKN